MTALDRFMTAAGALGIEPGVRRFPQGTKTAADAAAAIGCDLGQIVKSLVFSVDGRPVLALTSGVNRADVGAARRAGRRRGGAPSDPEEAGPRPDSRSAARRRSGTRLPCPCSSTATSSSIEEVWAAAGTPDSVFPLTPDDLDPACRTGRSRT